MASLGSPHAPGCCAHKPRHLNSSISCDGMVAWAGIIRYRHPRPQAVRAFTCDQHKELLENPRPYGEIPEHEAEMRRRIDILAGCARGEQWAVDAYRRLQAGG